MQAHELREFRASLTEHALTTAEKAAVLITLDECADAMERLSAALHDLLQADLMNPSCQAGAVPRCMCRMCATHRARSLLRA